MFGMIKFAIGLALLVMAFTVPLGNKTFAGHISAIWSSEEGRDLREGVKEKVDDIKGDPATDTNSSGNKTAPEQVTPKVKVRPMHTNRKRRSTNAGRSMGATKKARGRRTRTRTLSRR